MEHQRLHFARRRQCRMTRSADEGNSVMDVMRLKGCVMIAAEVEILESCLLLHLYPSVAGETLCQSASVIIELHRAEGRGQPRSLIRSEADDCRGRRRGREGITHTDHTEGDANSRKDACHILAHCSLRCSSAVLSCRFSAAAPTAAAAQRPHTPQQHTPRTQAHTPRAHMHAH